jgi:hypothetical protein
VQRISIRTVFTTLGLVFVGLGASIDTREAVSAVSPCATSD